MTLLLTALSCSSKKHSTHRFKHKTSKTYICQVYCFPYNLQVPLQNSLKDMKWVFTDNDETMKMRIYFKN